MKLNLDNLMIAAPCPAEWEKMAGDERVRFCGECRLNVYNVSDLSRAAAERLLREKEGKLCVRFFRRADGTILTQNCPVGLRRAKRAVERMVSAVAAMFGVVVGAGGCFMGTPVQPDSRRWATTQPRGGVMQGTPPQTTRPVAKAKCDQT